MVLVQRSDSESQKLFLYANYIIPITIQIINNKLF